MSALDLRELFDAVDALPAESQEAALRKLTNDEALIGQVLRICGHARADKTNFAAAVLNSAADISAKLAEEIKPDDVLGTWKLIEKIGQGGMGSVFLAERADGAFEQRVAIKVIHGLPTTAAKARLTQERQILAGLTHPNIARLFDGGATPSGQPYLVMELIEGAALDAHCANKNATFLDVLKLLLPICETVAVAHQRLIVHCDIKPANILVTSANRPVLLDFGIASLLSAESNAGNIDVEKVVGAAASMPSKNESTKLTRAVMSADGAMLAYTPRYASPEQKAGSAITTASDIFSLGRVLEELCEADANFAATAKTAGLVNPLQLKMREVRAIIQKACAPLPSQRYSSAANMADDIRRVLHGENVAAASAIPGYTSRKWLGRYVVAMAVGIGFVAMAAGFSVRLVEEKKLAQQQAANAETARAQAVLAQRESQTAKLDADQQRDRAVESDTLAQAAKAQAETSAGLETLAKQQAMASAALETTAKLTAEGAQAQALKERDRAVIAQASTTKVNDFLISIFDGVNPAKGGKRDASAKDVINLAEKRLDALKDIDASSQERLFNSLANVHFYLGETSKAIEYHEKRIKVLAQEGDKTVSQRINALGIIAGLKRDSQMPGSKEAMSEALALAKQHEAADPIRYVDTITLQIANYQAEALYFEAQKLAVVADPVWLRHVPDPWKNNRYLVFRHAVAHTERYLGNYAGAENEFKKVAEQRLLEMPINEDYLARTLVGLGVVLQEQGKMTEAEAAFKRAMEGTLKQNGEANSYYRTTILYYYAIFLSDTKRPEEARAVLDRMDALAQKYTQNAADDTRVLLVRAVLAEEAGQIVQAIQLQQRVAKVYTETLGANSRFAFERLNKIALLNLKIKDIAAAKTAANASYAAALKSYAANDEAALNIQRTKAAIALAEAQPVNAAVSLDGVVTAYGSTAPRFQQEVRFEAAKAWQAVAVATRVDANAADVAGVRGVAGAGGVAPTTTPAQAIARAREHARIALEMATKMGGEKSSAYQSAKALVAAL